MICRFQDCRATSASSESRARFSAGERGRRRWARHQTKMIRRAGNPAGARIVVPGQGATFLKPNRQVRAPRARMRGLPQRASGSHLRHGAPLIRAGPPKAINGLDVNRVPVLRVASASSRVIALLLHAIGPAPQAGVLEPSAQPSYAHPSASPTSARRSTLSGTLLPVARSLWCACGSLSPSTAQ